MLWDNIYEFFIKNVFGGVLWDNGGPSTYLATLGAAYSNNGGWAQRITGNAFFIHFTDTDYLMPLGNYLSLIATIITMVAILLFCVFIIKKIIGIIFRLFTGSSAF